MCEGHTCGECSNLVSGKYHDKTLRKCSVYGLTHSEASDWAKRWTACSMLNQEYHGEPVINFVRRTYQEQVSAETPLDGQITMGGI